MAIIENNNSLYRPLKIGKVELDGNVILAPMAGVSDLPFRLLCCEQGAAMCGMEMVSAKAILYKNKNTEELMEIHPEEKMVSLQLFGSDADIMAEIAAVLEERPFQILDINMGCPMPKITNNGEGSALLKNPELAAKIVEKVSKATKKPVTVKMRKGFDDNHINGVEFAKVMEQAGASAITVHGRTREQYYSGNADWDIIGEIKESLKIPVIGNGDIVSGKTAEKMLEYTGCDGIAIARAARGNPFIFREIIHYLKTGEECEKPSPVQKYEALVKHCTMAVKYKGEYTGIREMRKTLGYYSAGMRGSARVRGRINEMETLEDILTIARELFLAEEHNKDRQGCRK